MDKETEKSLQEYITYDHMPYFKVTAKRWVVYGVWAFLGYKFLL